MAENWWSIIEAAETSITGLFSEGEVDVQFCTGSYELLRPASARGAITTGRDLTNGIGAIGIAMGRLVKQEQSG
jgi:hypothetical protein